MISAELHILIELCSLQKLLTIWFPLWTLLFQPAIGVLMLGAVSVLPALHQRHPLVFFYFRPDRIPDSPCERKVSEKPRKN
jgi:hypothetical protein